MSSTERVAVSAAVNASPARVFAIVSDPAGHVLIDGSGMLEAAPDARPLTAVGDAFEMDMDREPLGDLPMGKYKVVNTVTRIVPDALIEWNVGTPEYGPVGHVYGWEIVPDGPDRSTVTNYCDWSQIRQAVRDRVTFPVVPLAMMEKSVQRLAEVAEGPEPS